MKYSKKRIKLLRLCRKTKGGGKILLCLALLGVILFCLQNIHQTLTSEETSSNQPPPRVINDEKTLNQILSEIGPNSDFNSIFGRLEQIRKRSQGQHEELLGKIYEKILWTSTNPLVQQIAYKNHKRILSKLGQYTRLMDTFKKISESPEHSAILVDQYLKMTDLYLARGDIKRARIYADKLSKQLENTPSSEWSDTYRKELALRRSKLSD